MKAVRPLKAIRFKCLDCSGWNAAEVERCAHTDCILYPLRFGKKPTTVTYSKMGIAEYRSVIENPKR